MKYLPLLLSLALIACTSTKPSASPKTGVTLETGSGGPLTETFTMAMPSGTPTVVGHGKEQGLGYGALTGTGGINASGVAIAHYLEDKTTIVGIQLNIPVPADGEFYEAWMEAEGKEPLSIGHLTNPYNDVRHNMRYESQKDLREFTIVRITKELDDGNIAQGQTVAIAILKPTTR